MYKEISNKLKEAKKDNNVQNIKKVILDLCSGIKSILESELNYKSLAEFVFDYEMIFKSNINKLPSKSADTEIHSNGLLTELLSFIEIKDAKIKSDKLSNAIDDLHSSVSSEENPDNIDDNIKLVNDALNDILTSVSV